MIRIEASEISKYKLEREVSDYIYQCIREKKEELKAFDGICTLKEIISLNKGDEGELYPEHGYVLLEYKGLLLRPFKKHGKQNSYKFYIVDSDYPYEMVKDFKNDHIEPNYIGKPTEKKMDEWLEYLLLEERYINERIKNKYNFKESYIKSLEDAGRVIVWQNRERTEGYINGNGFRFKITIGENAAYTKIEFDQYYKKDGKYVMESLETFDKLNEAMK